MAIFSKVRRPKIGRSVFNLSYEKKMTADMGYLFPTMCDEVVPGDIFKIGNEVVIRFNPMVAPLLHEVSCRIDYFFVPYRLLWPGWEDFITGGKSGTDASVLPRWEVDGGSACAVNSLWDFLGFPTGVALSGMDAPIIFPLYAYNFIYNNYYRDENLIDPVALYDSNIKARAWTKDYFTSALPFQQRGIAPSFPISGSGHAVWPDSAFQSIQPSGTDLVGVIGGDDDWISMNTYSLKAALHKNEVNFASAVTFNMADLRLGGQIQRFMERNARAGVRYTEFLKAHFNASPSDERLDRPEYIGGFKAPVIFSEVLQTSSTDSTTPQGNMAGHGLLADKQFVASYHVQEFGLIMGIFSVMPRPAYQQGINRQWLRRSRYDFYFPEFANLSEQAVEMEEIYAQPTSGGRNRVIFGYQGRYSEMRYKPNLVAGLMRTTFNYWHLGRIFSGEPALNANFINASDVTKRVFAVQNVPELIVNISNKIVAIRPMPYEPEPGLFDHG